MEIKDLKKQELNIETLFNLLSFIFKMRKQFIKRFK